MIPFFILSKSNFFSIRSEKSKPGFHESVFCGLQALRDKEVSMFDETLKQARYGRHLDTQFYLWYNGIRCLLWPDYLPTYELVCFDQGCRSGGAVQRQPRGCVFSVPGPQEPAEHQGAGECQTALLKVNSNISNNIFEILDLRILTKVCVFLLYVSDAFQMLPWGKFAASGDSIPSCSQTVTLHWWSPFWPCALFPRTRWCPGWETPTAPSTSALCSPNTWWSSAGWLVMLGTHR